jgi:hypothetical protein
MLSIDRHAPISTAKSRSAGRFIPSLYQVALAAVLGAVLVVALAPRLDTDFWWHLKVGQYISVHHVVPAHDFMSFTLAGHAWTDHEWLAELLLYGLFRIAGLWGPITFFAVVILATFSLVYLRMAQQRVNRVLALFLVAAAFIASSASWGPRIQMMTLLFLAAYAAILERYDQTRNRRLLLLFPVIMLLWTNVHGGFVLGLVVLIITLAGEWLNRTTHRPGAWGAADLRALGWALAGSVAVTMINPNGVRQLLYPLTFVLPNPYTNLIQESASPNFHMPVIMVFELMLLALIASAFIGRRRLNWTHLLLVLAFTHLAFSQVRNVAVWAVVISPLVAYYLQGLGPVLHDLFPGVRYRRRPVGGVAASILNLVLVLLVALAYAVEGTHFVNAAALRQAETDNFPRGAVQYLDRHSLPSRVFVSYGWGGYLLWHVFPRYRDFMDSRADTLYTARILDAYLAAYDASPDWQTVLRSYRVETVLVERTAPLAQVLARSAAWRPRYRDGLAVLYTRAPGSPGGG